MADPAAASHPTARQQHRRRPGFLVPSPPSPPTGSPDSDVSPTSQAPRKDPNAPPRDYFAPSTARGTRAASEADQGGDSESSSQSTSTITSPVLFGTRALQLLDGGRRSPDGRPDPDSRKSSTASVTFRAPVDPSLPQGRQRRTDAGRLRASSPTPTRFRPHVAFDNVVAGEATKSNTPSYTVNVRHAGYQPKRRSRTFMVGVDEHPYSNDALQWLLDEFVDDGDEVVCVRVLEKDVRAVGDRNYQEEANAIMAKIQERSGSSRAISIVLEYAVGKLHSTFQRLIQMYQPSMLIVGTRGRSLGGIQGLVNTRNSFSKYCLQYSPIPVVVVRPDDKRQKKKEKRSLDPEKHSYIKMLAQTRGVHEADSETGSLYDMEARIPADEEAHRVAAAIGLPAAFDPTLRPLREPVVPPQRHLSSASASSAGLQPSSSAASTPLATPTGEPSDPLAGRVLAPAVSPDSGDDESEEDEEEPEFDVESGSQILQEKKKEKLHRMEVGEAAALLQSNPAVEDESDSDSEGGGGKVGGS